MGTNLIIKGADFSQNRIVEVVEATVLQGFAITNPNNPDYGLLYLANNISISNSILAKIFIPAGKSASIRVNNYDTLITDLNLGFIASQNNVEFVDRNAVTNIVLTNHPADAAFREDSGEFLVPNNTVNGLYFYMNFCYDIINGPEFSIANKHVFYVID